MISKSEHVMTETTNCYALSLTLSCQQVWSSFGHSWRIGVWEAPSHLASVECTWVLSPRYLIKENRLRQEDNSQPCNLRSHSWNVINCCRHQYYRRKYNLLWDKMIPSSFFISMICDLTVYTAKSNNKITSQHCAQLCILLSTSSSSPPKAKYLESDVLQFSIPQKGFS